jgi:hypothetical protein
MKYNSNSINIIRNSNYHTFHNHHINNNYNNRNNNHYNLQNHQSFKYQNKFSLRLKNDNNNNDIKNEYETRDYEYETRDYESLGAFKYFAEDLDKRTGGFALQYADTSPYKVNDTIGITFLATNLFYFISGIDIFNNNQPLYAGIIECAGLISSYYHFNQLYYGPGKTEVRVALLIDYFSASLAILATLYQYITIVIFLHIIPFKALSLGSLGVMFLLLSWKFEYGLPYIFFHGFWHVFSALSASDVTTITFNNGL